MMTDFVTELETERRELGLDDLATLLKVLAVAERPRSLRAMFWLLLRTLQDAPKLHARVVEAWLPSEADLAQLIEDAGAEGAQAVLSLTTVKEQLERVWALCDEVGVANLVSTSNAWEAVALAPMAALHTERQLDALVAAVARDRPWKDPADVLHAEGDDEFDLEALLALAQARMVQAGGGEVLSTVVLRLLSCAEKVH